MGRGRQIRPGLSDCAQPWPLPRSSPHLATRPPSSDPPQLRRGGTGKGRITKGRGHQRGVPRKPPQRKAKAVAEHGTRCSSGGHRGGSLVRLPIVAWRPVPSCETVRSPPERNRDAVTFGDKLRARVVQSKALRVDRKRLRFCLCQPVVAAGLGRIKQGLPRRQLCPTREVLFEICALLDEPRLTSSALAPEPAC